MPLLDMSIRRHNEKGLLLANSLFGRLVFAAFAVALVAGMVFQGFHFAPFLLAILSALGAFYDERWEVPAGGGRLHHRVGLGSLAKRESWEFSAIEEIVLSEFSKARPRGAKVEDESGVPDASLAGGARAAARASRPGAREARRSHIVRILLRFYDGEEKVVEMTGPRGRRRLEESAVALARATGLGMVRERE